MKYVVRYSANFKKAYKKLAKQMEISAVDEVISKLANGDILEQKYRDHKLQGEYKDHRECHIKPDLLLIYKKQDDVLILTLIELGSHSELF